MITILPQLLKHQLLTGDEAYKCLSPTIPPQQKAHELLSYLKHKENEVLQKLLCSLCKETTHAGHKDVATVLQDAMRSHNLEFGQICSLCKEDAISAKGKQSYIIIVKNVVHIYICVLHRKYDEVDNHKACICNLQITFGG